MMASLLLLGIILTYGVISLLVLSSIISRLLSTTYDIADDNQDRLKSILRSMAPVLALIGIVVFAYALLSFVFLGVKLANLNLLIAILAFSAIGVCRLAMALIWFKFPLRRSAQVEEDVGPHEDSERQPSENRSK